MRLRQSTIERLLEDQYRLNDKFNVSRWDESLVSIALLAEFAEMMNEIQTSWKNWKQVTDDIEAAKVEMIDCVHFMLSLMLIRRQSDPNGRLVQLPRLEVRSGDFLYDIAKNMKNFINAESSYPITIQRFVEFVDIMTERLEMDEIEFIRFFETKAAINAERAAGGYADGKYVAKELERLRFVN